MQPPSFNRGLSYAAISEHQKAIDDFTIAIELDPKNTNAYYYRGLSYALLGDLQNAIEDCGHAIELDPNYVLAYIVRGNYYSQLGKHQHAVDDFTKAIELDPQNTDAYENRGITYVLLKKYEEARQDLERGNSDLNLTLLDVVMERDKITGSYIEGLRAQFDPTDQSYYLRSEITGRTKRLDGLRLKRTLALVLLMVVSFSAAGIALCLIINHLPVGVDSGFSIVSISLITLAAVSPFGWAIRLFQHDITIEEALLESCKTKEEVLLRIDWALRDAENEEERKSLNKKLIEFLTELRLANLLLTKDSKTSSATDQQLNINIPKVSDKE